MAPDTMWSRGPDSMQVHCQVSGLKGSGVGSSTWPGTMRMSPLLDPYKCQRSGARHSGAGGGGVDSDIWP